MNKNTLGSRLKEKRLKMGLKQIEVAAALGCAPTSLTNYERGIINPPLEVLSKLCEILEVSALELLERKYNFNDILKILKKPVNERSYEEQIAINFSYPILEKQTSTELRRLEKECENQRYISEKTGLSPVAIEALDTGDELIFDENEDKISPVGLEALNKLLSCKQGLLALNSIAVYLRAEDFCFSNGEKTVQIDVGDFEGRNKTIHKTFHLTANMEKAIVRDEFLRLLDEIKVIEHEGTAKPEKIKINNKSSKGRKKS